MISKILLHDKGQPNPIFIRLQGQGNLEIA